jgi:helicase
LKPQNYLKFIEFTENVPKTIQIKEQYKDTTINIVLDTLEKQKQALVFCNSKRSAEKTAEDISYKVKKITDAEKRKLIELSEKVLKSLPKSTKQCERLARCVKQGIAFHHAGLTMDQKTLIEDGFREDVIKIISCTPTLAFGLDLPAFRVVIKNLGRFGPRGMQPIPVLEYHQMCGRAGRPGKAAWGEAITIATTEAGKEKITEDFIKADAEDIFSKLAVEPVLRFYLLSLISTDFVRTRKQIMDFFNKTFWAFQFSDMHELMQKINKMLILLEKFEFIETAKGKAEALKQNKNKKDKENDVYDDFMTADEIYNEANKSKTDMGFEDVEEKFNATALGKRVAELYIDPLTAYEIICAMKRSKIKQVLPISILQMLCVTLELRPKLRVKAKEQDEVIGRLVEFESNMIVPEPSQFDPEYDDYVNSFKTALFFNDWIEENDEEFLLEKYDVRPGEIKAKIEKADWLLYAGIELGKILGLKKIGDEKKNMVAELSKMRLRMKYGVKEELLALLKLKKVGRVRARKLYGHGIKDLGDIKKANIISLAQLIGKKTAIDIKDQVGEKVLEKDIKIKENKRKGQISLMDF